MTGCRWEKERRGEKRASLARDYASLRLFVVYEEICALFPGERQVSRKILKEKKSPRESRAYFASEIRAREIYADNRLTSIR